MKRIFGIRHIGIFKPLIEFDDDGFVYNNKKYLWHEIILIKRDDSFISAFARYPSTSILISDGCIIRIPTIIEEKGKYEGFKFQAFKYKNESYDDVISLLESNVAPKFSNLKKYIFSCNEIMFYRYLIIVGLIIFLLLIGTVIFLSVKIHIEIISLGLLSFVAIISGLFLYFRRYRNEGYLKRFIREKGKG